MFDRLKNSLCQRFKAFSFEKSMKNLDWLTLPVGVAAIVVNLILPDSNPFRYISVGVTVLAAILGLMYIVYAAYLWHRRPVFDSHMIKGSFLRRVCCLVVLMPSILAVMGWMVIRSPKELVYDGNLYEQTDSLTTDIYSRQTSPNLYWTTYYHFIDPGNEHMTTTKAGRVWAALIGILGVFLLNGLLVSSMMGWIDSRKEKWLKGEVKYKKFLDRNCHYVIIGGNDMVEGIVRQILPDGNYILILTSRDVESFRRELFSNLTEHEQNRIIIYYGNRTSKEDISELGLGNVKEVYLLGEEVRNDDIESYHDTINMQCLRLISEELAVYDKYVQNADSDNRLVCRIMFEYQSSFNLFQVTDIDADKIKFLPFNYYEKWAQNVLICRNIGDAEDTKYQPLEGLQGIKSKDETYVHLIVVGMTRMGVAMGIEAAHLAHYPNYESKNVRTRITFIDDNAAEEKDFFMGRFKELFSLSHWSYGDIENGKLKMEHHSKHLANTHLGGDFLDVEWEFINGSVEMPAIQKYIADSTSEKNARVTIAVCIPENNRAIAAATYLPQSVYQSDSTLQILVYQRLNDELLRQLNECNGRYCGKLRAFGMAKDCYDAVLVGISEFIEPYISEAYDSYSWNMLLARYRGKGLIDEDYAKLTGWMYNAKSNDPGEQKRNAALRDRCDKWMGEGHAESDLKAFVKHLKAEFCVEVKPANPTPGGKSKSAAMWSNHYNIYTMWSKFRCVTTADGHRFNPLNEEFDALDSEMMAELGKVEHNRWVMEQLLLRFRPLDESEQAQAMVKDMYASSDVKTFYKKKKNGHLDICSNERLNEIDFNIAELDKELIAVLPSAYKDYLLKS